MQRLTRSHEGEYLRNVGGAFAVIIPLALLLAAIICWSDSHL